MKTEEKRKADCLQVMEQEQKSREQQVAEISLNPITLNTNTARVFSSGVFGELAITESIEVVRKMTDAVVQGSNLNELEELLTTQAVALNGIFNYLALRAHTNIGHYPETVERYMKLALKAQSQCRSTIEAINEIKNPSSATFVRQANIGNAVQVNNGKPNLTSTHAGARTGEKQTEPNKLLAADQPATLPTFNGGVINDLDSRKAAAAV
jgi:hypothetical protein